jgi:drug/metabolite transporter (DMT)-like permease
LGLAAGLAAFALVSFAANSLLCRLALGSDAIDAGSYAAVRLVSGAATLLGLAALAGKGRSVAASGSLASAGALLLYALAFSYAYRTIPAGTGALILFACVQATMIGSALFSGERPGKLQWVGLLLALAGLGYLVRPGLAAPPVMGSALMAVAGAAWGVYSLRGRRSRDPLLETAANFTRAAPLAVLASLLIPGTMHGGRRGILLAGLSGAIASGVGYAAWYAALPRLTSTRAATLQLAVPVLAAAGAVAWLGEQVSTRLVLASLAILGGVALAMAGGQKHAGGT